MFRFQFFEEKKIENGTHFAFSILNWFSPPKFQKLFEIERDENKTKNYFKVEHIENETKS